MIPRTVVRKIPVAYIRIVDQLERESTHGTHNDGHEALRRANYAEETLDAFGRELCHRDGSGPGFRSKVLNPIMQRQRAGIPSHYTPHVRNSMGGRTIRHATRLYLSQDPVDPNVIPFYRRSLIYVPEVRWHLGLMMGNLDIKSTVDFNGIQENHNIIMKNLRDVPQPVSQGRIHPFNLAEAEVIVAEGLNTFFGDELKLSVRSPFVSALDLII